MGWLNGLGSRWIQSVGGVVQAGRRIELEADAAKPELLQHSAGGSVLWVVARDESSRLEPFKRVSNHGPAGLRGQSLAPKGGPEVDSKLVDSWFAIVGPQSGCANKFSGREEEERPVLDPVQTHRLDLAPESVLNRFWGERAANESRHSSVSPERPREGEIGERPTAEAKSLREEKIRIGIGVLGESHTSVTLTDAIPLTSSHASYPPRYVGPPMDRDTVLASFDLEMRRNPPPVEGYRVENVGSLVRFVGPAERTILYSRPGPSEIVHVIIAEVHEMTEGGPPLEWKIYSHDGLDELSRRLAASGFRPNPHETLMVFDLSFTIPSGPGIPGLEVRQVRDEAGLEDLEAVDRSAFGREHPAAFASIRSRILDPHFGVFVAYVDGSPAAGGRVECDAGRSFAGLFGGGTAPKFQRRGIYHELVRVRAEFARRAGARYLTVEAVDTTSRPILEKVGFVPLAGVEGWVLDSARDFRPPDEDLSASRTDRPTH